MDRFLNAPQPPAWRLSEFKRALHDLFEVHDQEDVVVDSAARTAAFIEEGMIAAERLAHMKANPTDWSPAPDERRPPSEVRRELWKLVRVLSSLSPMARAYLAFPREPDTVLEMLAQSGHLDDAQMMTAAQDLYAKWVDAIEANQSLLDLTGASSIVDELAARAERAVTQVRREPDALRGSVAFEAACVLEHFAIPLSATPTGPFVELLALIIAIVELPYDARTIAREYLAADQKAQAFAPQWIEGDDDS